MSLVGIAQPRLFTEPLHDLSDRNWTRGHEVAEFAEGLGEPLYPWQREAVLRGLELNEDRSYRFDIVLVLVSRQNGKSHLLRTISLWKMMNNPRLLVVGAAQDRRQAMEVWDLTVNTAKYGNNDDVRKRVKKVRTANGQETLLLDNGSRYIITAASRGAGRGLSVGQLNLDELREWKDEEPWSALSPTTSAVENSQIWIFSNAGDDQSVVLNRLQESANNNPTMCILEWSAPEGCELDDEEAWTYANPSLGHIKGLEAKLRSAVNSDRPATFRTERLCQRVVTLNESVDMAAWSDCQDDQSTLENYKGGIHLGVDVSFDGQHVTVCAAARDKSGLTRLEVAAAYNSTTEARTELPGLFKKIRPRSIGWFSGGPSAPISLLMRNQGKSLEISGAKIPEVCMFFNDQVSSRRIIHNGDKLLLAHLSASARTPVGDGWRFTRRGAVGHVDAAYAASAAVYAAQSAPPMKSAWSFVVGQGQIA